MKGSPAMKIKIRPSKRPLSLLCASSVLDPQFPISSDNIYTRKGKGVHDSIVLVLRDGMAPDDAVEKVATRYGINTEEVAELLHNARRALANIEDHLPEGTVFYERSLSRGTPDWMLVSEDLIVIIDWKSGMLETDAKEQLTDYADQARAEFGNKPVKAIAINLAVGSSYTHDIGQDEIDAMWQRDTQVQRNAGKEYAPGSHCGYCPMRYECEARTQYALACMYALTDATIDDLSYEHLSALYPQVLLLEKVLDDYRSALRAAVIDAQPLPLPDGRELVMIDKKKMHIDPRHAWPVLAQRFSEEQMRAFVAIKKTAVVKAVKSNAPRGKGAAAEREFVNQLDKAGAVSYVLQRSISARKPKG